MSAERGAELNLADYPPAVLNTIAAVLRDRMHVEEGYMILSERFDAAAHVIDALRSLPVEQRMEAMGMVEVSGPRSRPMYVEASDA